MTERVRTRVHSGHEYEFETDKLSSNHRSEAAVQGSILIKNIS